MKRTPQDSGSYSLGEQKSGPVFAPKQIMIASSLGRCWRRVGTFSVVCASALTQLETSRGNVLFSDDFSYVDGSLVTVSSGSWATSSGTAGQMDVLSGVVNVTRTETEDVNHDFLATGSGTIYFSMTTVFSEIPTTSGNYFAHFWDKETGADTDFFGRLFVKQGSSATQLLFGIANDSGNAAVYSATEFALGSTVQVVVGFDFSTMTSTLWINPVDTSSPAVTDTVVATFTGGPTTTLGGFSLRQASGIGTFIVDDVVVGTTFDDVVPVPEPSTLAFLGLAGVVLYVRRRKRA